MLRYLRPLRPVLLLFPSVIGCGGNGDNGDGGTPPPTTTIARASVSSGEGQQGTVGEPLANPLRVIVTQDGAPEPGVTVAWSATGSGASVNPASAVTDAEGIAATTWTLGITAGSQSAQASLTGASGSPVTFTATATPDDPATLSKLSGDQQIAPVNTQLASPVQAKVSDRHGNGVAGVPVAWSASGATVSASSVLTDASGASAVTVTLGGEQGPITITAEASDLSGSPQIFSATARPPGAGTADVTVGNNSFTPSTLTVSPGTTVVWTWVNTGTVSHSVESTGSPSFPSSPILTGNGQSYSFTFSTAGTYQYTCSVHPVQMSGSVVVQ